MNLKAEKPVSLDFPPLVMSDAKRSNKPDERGFIYREAVVAAVREDAMECELAFSSEQPVRRYDWRDGKEYMEVLSHAPGDCDLSRMNNKHPLLVNHNTNDQVGVVKSATIDADKKGRATVKFSKSARGKEIWQDVKDGIRGLVSVGYVTTKEIKRETVDGLETRTFAWMPYETSLVPIPADNTVGVGRSQEPATPATTENTLTQTKNMSENTTPAPVINEAQIRADVAKSEQKRANEILGVGKKFNLLTEAADAIRDGKSTEEFYRAALEKVNNAKPITGDAAIGMSKKEERDYSLVKAIRALASGNWKGAELEREASDAMAKMIGRETGGFFIPTEIAHKRSDLVAGTNNLGKYTVQTDVLGSSLIELLRNATVTKELGARQLSGLQGNVAIPSQSGGATAYWVAENGQTTQGNLTFGQVALTPKRLSATSSISKQLIAQSTVDVEGLVRMDFARQMAIALDAAALTGDGQSNNPTGILSTASIGSITFGGAATYQDFVDMEASLATANALLGSPAFVVDSATRAKLRILPQLGSTFPTWVWEKAIANGIAGEGSILGYRAVSTQQLVDSHKVIFGNFNDLIIADWVGMDVTVDPYTLADKNQIKITVNGLFDVGVRHVGSFCASSDSGAQ